MSRPTLKVFGAGVADPIVYVADRYGKLATAGNLIPPGLAIAERRPPGSSWPAPLPLGGASTASISVGWGPV